MKWVPKTDAGGDEKLIFNKINSGLKAVFEARSVKATLKIAMYEAAKLPRSSICMEQQRSASLINSWSVYLRFGVMHVSIRLQVC